MVKKSKKGERRLIFRDVGECSVEVMEEEFCHCKRDWCPRYWEIYRARRIRTIILILKLGLNDFDYLYDKPDTLHFLKGKIIIIKRLTEIRKEEQRETRGY